MDLRSKTQNSYVNRATYYNNKTDWVTKCKCIDPLVPSVYGRGVALDVCSGTGEISNALINKGWTVISVDLSRNMLQINVNPLRLICDMHNLPFEKNMFDLVVCRQGLQYADINLALNEFVRVGISKIRLGHITKESNDNYDFWKNYFEIASPGRIHILEPNQICELAQSIGLRTFLLNIFRQRDSYLGPIMHLPKQNITYLINLLSNTSEEFKKIYGVKKDNNEIVYSNRWEFLEINF
jgi:hypothetical protein